VDALLAEHKDLQGRMKKIMTIPGIGKITAASVIAETHGFAQIRNKRQLVSYAGYDVINQQSGTSIKTKPRISKRGNRHIRGAMHMPALSAINHNQTQKDAFVRIVSKSGIKMKGVVAVQRKLLVLMYTLWKNDTEFDPSFEQNKKGRHNTTLHELDQVRSL